MNSYKEELTQELALAKLTNLTLPKDLHVVINEGTFLNFCHDLTSPDPSKLYSQHYVSFISAAILLGLLGVTSDGHQEYKRSLRKARTMRLNFTKSSPYVQRILEATTLSYRKALILANELERSSLALDLYLDSSQNLSPNQALALSKSVTN